MSFGDFLADFYEHPSLLKNGLIQQARSAYLR
jgi:hypothetical protein